MGSGGKDAVKAAEDAAAAQMTDYTAQARIAKGVVEKQKQEYKDIEFKNPYADLENAYAGMENTFEDVTVNQQQAQFQAQQGAQQRSNIMQGLRGAAGSSGVAGLAQAMANQGQLATQQIGASIGQQESAIQRSKAQEAGRIQTLERQGEGAADLQRRQGEAMVQQAETGRVSTLLGMEYGELQAAQAGKAAAYQNQQNAAAMELERVGQNKALTGQIIGSVVGGASTLVAGGGIIKGVGGSDRRLKKNINKIGQSPSGLNIYSFEYKNSKYGNGLFQGVMSDEIPQEAVINNGEYDMVNYNMLDVEFKQI